MPSLTSAVDAVLGKVDGHPTSAFNEENTAVVLIEPLLAALGWDPSDLASVHRQYKVYDGTRLDYALMLDGKPALFVEVKGVGHGLDNPQFIAQTVNYANNEGVLWCVLTNGLVYRLYKTNEPVPMVDKLMLEIDLKSAKNEDGRGVVLTALERLSRASLESGALADLAELVFVGGKVRTAIEGLLADPSPGFTKAVLERAGGVSGKSLARVLRYFAVVQKAVPAAPSTGGVSAKLVEAASSSKAGYDRAHHITGKPKAVTDLFDQLDGRLRAVGEVKVSYLKQYINYATTKKSFATVQLFRDRLKVYYSIPWEEAPKLQPEVMRDVTHVGHYGMGDTELILSTPSELEAATQLGQISFKRNGG
jgi:predicted transport protein